MKNTLDIVERVICLYDRFLTMHRRCHKGSARKHNYHSRGIEVSEEWRGQAGLRAFIAWGLANGFNYKLVLDREDNDRGYSPDNCRWVTHSTNSRNGRNSVMLEYRGKVYNMKTLSEHPDCLVNYATFGARISAGWSVEKAVNTVSHHKRKNKKVGRPRKWSTV